MAISRTSLNFTTLGQSLWGPGYAVGFSVDSGESLIYNSGKQTQEIDIDAGIFGVTGTGYVQFRVGLFAYAHLGSTGGFDASFNIDVNVDHVGGVETGPGAFVNFDFSDWEVANGTISSVGFDGSPRAGLDLIVELEAGIENGNVFYPFGDTDFDFSLIDLEIVFPIVGFDASDLTLEFSLFDEAVTITGQLPTGANTEGASGLNELVLSSTGQGNDFLSVDADIDALLTQLLEKIPGAGQVVKALSETVFGEHRFDLHDYLSFIPQNKFVLAATMLDVSAYAGIHLTEDLDLDITGTDADEATPDVMITLVSDNGTADISDDRVYQTVLGGNVNVAAPEQMLGGPALSPTGTMNVTATYSLENTTLNHDVGLGLNASLTITALFAELQGEWVPDFLKFELGPLFEITFPEGGFSAELFEVYDPDPFLLQANAFNTVSDTYEVFYTNDAPELWDVSTFENAQNTYLEYRKALVEVFNQSYADFSYLFTPPQTALPAEGTINQPSFTDRSATWIANVDSGVTLSEAAGSDNFVIIDPNENTAQLALGRLQVNIGTTTQITAGGPRVFSSGGITSVDYLLNSLDAATLLNALATTSGKTIIYEHVPVNGTSPKTTLITTNAVEIEGNGRGDILVFFPGENGNRPSHFDGDTEGAEYDRFVANFLASDPNSAVNLNLQHANTVTPTQFTTIFAETVDTNDDVNLREIEAISLRTGNADDTITTYVFADFLETNGGRDVVTNVADAASDVIRLGAGDDFVVSSSLLGNGHDDIFGGTGFDIAVHTATVGQRLDLMVNGSYVSSGTGSTTGVGAAASLHQAASLMVAAANLFTLTPLSTRVTWDDTGDTSNDWLIYKNGSAATDGSTIYRASVEAIGFYGSAADDAVLFTGGPVTTGAGGYDLLIADLHGYQTYLNVNSGINLIGNGDGSPIRFGDVLIDDFEKWSVIGTTFGDYLSGGIFGDVLSGEEGNDRIYGGTDTVADYLMGGAGTDTFVWRDTGADMMDGDNGFYAGGAALDYLDIGPGNQEEQHGLYHDFHTFLGDLFGNNGVDRGSKAFYTATDTTAQLLEAMALSADSSLTRGVSFQGTTNADFMTYINIESVNMQGTETMDDLLIYQGGTSYIGYDNSSSETDTFVADFSAQNVGIYLSSFDLTSTIFQTGPFDPLPGVVALGNGVNIQGIERVILKMGSGSDDVSGGDRNDYLSGGAGGDRLNGGNGNDIVNGDAGDDRLFWNSGVDIYDGGADNDLLVIMGGGIEFNLVNGSGGVFGTRASAYTTIQGDFRTILDSVSDAAAFQVTIRNQGDSLTFDNIEQTNIFGQNATNDVLLYHNGLVYSGGESVGDRDIFMADLSESTEAISYDGNAIGTNDGVLNSVRFGKAVLAGIEEMVVSLGSGDDTYLGTAGLDDIHGGDGDDYIEGGSGGNDRLYGGDGDDTMVFNGAGSTLLDGGNGYDRLSFENVVDTLYLSFAGDSGLTGSLFVADYAAIDTVMDALATGTNFQHAFAANGTTQFATFDNFEEIKTTASLPGGIMVAGSQRGYMVGSTINADVFLSREGSDVMIGLGGQDRYLFDRDFGTDVIAGEELDDWTNQNNFTGGEVFFTDRNFSEAIVTRQNNNINIAFDGGSNLTIIDYFVNGSQYGMDFTFHFADAAATYLEVTALSGQSPGADLTDGLTVMGTDGNDKSIFAATTDFRDTYFGGNGDDLMLGSLGSDIFDGGAGLDMVSYLDLVDGVSIDLNLSQGFSGAALGDVFLGIENIAGGQGSNTLRGDRWANTLVGGNNADLFEGRGGDDTLLGLDGDDEILGDEGDDRIYGDGGSDLLHGNDDNDYLSGGADNDVIHGDAGDDTLDGGEGDDALFGGTGDDTMTFGGKEDSALAGFEDGIDTFDGGDNTPGIGDTADYSRFTSAIGVDMRLIDNTITTRNGEAYLTDTGATRTISHLLNVENVTGTKFNDDFIGTAGTNGFDGGAGDDTFVGGDNFDIIIGGAGSDTIDYSRDGGPIGLTQFWTDTVAFYVIDTFGASDLLQSVENVIGTGFGDYFYMNSADNVVRGMGGVDTINGHHGNDTIIGGADGDVMFGGNGFDILSYEGSTVGVYIDLEFFIAFGGDAQGDTFAEFEGVRGSEAADTLHGNDANFPDGTGGNLLDGGAGDDYLFSYLGNDTLIGGTGADYLDGGQGIDSASYRTAKAGLTARLSGVGNTGDAAGDFYVDIEDLQGSDFDDVLEGSSGDNALYGEAGNDTLFGLGGSDLLFGGAGDDTLIGGDDADFLDGGYGNNDTASYLGTNIQVIANLADDDLNLGAALGDQFRRIENLTGGSAGDILTGNDGNNVLDGGAGLDELNGGKGNDTYIVDDVNEAVVELANEGTDTVVSMVSFNLGLNVGRAHVEHLKLLGPAALNGTGNGLDNTITGNEFANVIDGGLGIDQMHGGLGDDTYVVSQSGDKAFEAQDEGIDTVLSAISYNLGGQYIENLTLTGSGNTNGTGNSLNNLLTGNSGNNRLAGGAGADTVNWAAATSGLTIVLDANGHGVVRGTGIGTDTFTGIENVIGGSGGDHITGNAQNNRIDGGLGIDQMFGGAGNDSYWVNETGDKAFEIDGQGIDTVYSAVSYNMGGQYVDNVTLTGTRNSTVTGNSQNNIFIGNSGNNTFIGNGGADTVNFAAATSALVITLDATGAGSVTGAGIGTDTFSTIENVVGGLLGDTITGNASVNKLDGGLGNDLIDGGAGADKLHGGLGDDTFIVSDVGDKVYEAINEGIDTVLSSISFSLAGQYVDNLTLTGTANINATGNSLDNVITGNAGNNTLAGGSGRDTADFSAATSALSITLSTSGGGSVTGTGIGTDTFSSIENIIGGSAGDTITGNAQANRIDGGGGSDMMHGGLGDDTFIVSQSGDRVFELNNQGADTVFASVSFSTAGQYIENVTLTGSAAINATGNSLNNVLTGNGANNTLVTGTGLDIVVFNTALGASNVDTITDFNVANDTIRLDRAVFTAFTTAGVIGAGQFQDLALGAADTSDRILYDSATGDLFYDARGSGVGAAIRFGVLGNGALLTFEDILIA